MLTAFERDTQMHEFLTESGDRLELPAAGVLGAIIFAIVKQMTSDSEPEPYDPAASNS